MSESLQLGTLHWPEIVMMLVVALVLFGARRLPELLRGLGSGINEFIKATRDVRDDLDHALFGGPPMSKGEPSTGPAFSRSFTLWIAQGFGIGRIPKAPGTFGSVLGLGWFALLLWIGGIQPWLAAFILLASIIASVWTCDAAEKILGAKDPGSIVIDEIVAVPVCFLGWVFHLALRLGELPSLDFFFGSTTWFLALGVFLAFRFFDIAKPWPVKQSQEIPRGWGVVMDDLLAAVYVNLVILVIHLGLQFSTATMSN